MGRQTFQDESNYKHEPHAKHYVDDDFGKGTGTRNWKHMNREVIEEKTDETNQSSPEDPEVLAGSEENSNELERDKSRTETDPDVTPPERH